MPVIPTTVGISDPSGVGTSPLLQQKNQQIAPKNLLMASAVMRHLGKLSQPAPRMSQKKTKTATGPA